MPSRRELIPPGPKLDELHGMAAAKAWGEDLARDLADYIAGRIAWSAVDPGVLLCGPPGTGKTMFARALAATCQVPLIVTSYAQWQRSKDGHMGDVLAAMHAAFKLAQQYAPCILFIDEIEAVSSRQVGGHNQRWYTGVIAALNEEINATLEHKGVVVIAATNYPDRIDPALLRAGRLDNKIAIPMPTAEDLEGIIRFHLEEDIPDADLRDLALATVGMTGADVKRLVRVARRRARSFPRGLLCEDLSAILGEKLRDIPQEYLERIAIHESGHATMAVLLGVSRNVSVSLYDLGKGGATTFFDPWIEAVTRGVVEDKIAVALAGRAAEQILLGNVTAGAGGSESSDLGLATTLAYWAVARWGLSERDHLKWVDCPLEQIISVHPELAGEAHLMLHGAYARACSLISERASQVRAIANALLKRRALAHADIASLLARAHAGAKRSVAQRSRRRA